MPASTTPSRVRVEGCLKKKGVYPFNKGPTPGPSQEFSHYLPTASSARQSREGVGQILGVLWGGVLAPLSRSLPGCQCQSPGLRALLEEVDNVEAGEPCRPGWGGLGLLGAP